MVGRYEIVLYNNKVHYQLDIKRNITVLRGDSASGKSELIRLLSLYNSNPSSSGITLIADTQCNVLTEENWRLFIDTYRGRIFFVDEGNSFLKTKEFANAVRGADNYFVIVSRESLPQLPYSIEEIYGLRGGKDAGKYRSAKRIYNEMYRIYGDNHLDDNTPELVITEDSNSGKDFFEELFPEKCESANGKSNITKKIALCQASSLLVVVDGAAFGPEMQSCMELILSSNKKISLFAPESFEYLLLSSDLVDVQKDLLDQTWDYADSKSYLSWEEFYTKLLCDKSRNEVYQYSKHKLNDYYKTKGSVDRILKVFPEEIRKLVNK